MKSRAGSPAFNMALDEALLVEMPRIGVPVLRFYAWTDPAASFGYFQRHSEVERLTHLRPLVRRPTAGGIVPHDRDWTYSVSIPVGTDWYGNRAAESYRRMHTWLQTAFRMLGFETDLAERRVPSEGQCFVGYAQSDLLWQGEKIAGAAQRRTRSGLLIQGSVRAPWMHLRRERWEEAMISAGPGGSDVTWVQFEGDEELSRRLAELAQRKYALPGWNLKR